MGSIMAIELVPPPMVSEAPPRVTTGTLRIVSMYSSMRTNGSPVWVRLEKIVSNTTDLRFCFRSIILEMVCTVR